MIPLSTVISGTCFLIFSGSTCVSVIYTENKLICANVGDSRAVLGRYVNDSTEFT
jgi:hypothetical protein